MQRDHRVGDAVGVVIAEGEIVDGPAPPGTVGGLSTAALIRKARDDDTIRAVVLRVNSPGGSVFGSELVRRELELTRAAGKPVVVSMGDVAASGGYWISTSADEVIADAATVTGSIGVFGLLPGVEQGASTSSASMSTASPPRGCGAARRSAPARSTRAMRQVVQASIDHVYADFTARVAQARQTTPEKIDAVAQGRVWTGAQALERGLVDRLGSYGDALDAAAARGRLDKGYRVAYIERDAGAFARAHRDVRRRGGAGLGRGLGARPRRRRPAGRGRARRRPRPAAGSAQLVDGSRPFAAVAHCLCVVP